MTLLLVWSEDSQITVIADTLFGAPDGSGSTAGPKIFHLPIRVSDLDDEVFETLPSMGFAFAGNTVSGQFTQALAATCLQNLAAPNRDNRPSVGDIAQFVANCALRVVEERSRRKALDGYGFDALVFGHSPELGRPQAFHFKVAWNEEARYVAPVGELTFSEDPIHAFGSGARYARQMREDLKRHGHAVHPQDLMDLTIASPDEPTVGGEYQGATAFPSGVELRPVMRSFDREGRPDVDYGVMGINMHAVGMVAGYIPVGLPLQAVYDETLVTALRAVIAERERAKGL